MRKLRGWSSLVVAVLGLSAAAAAAPLPEAEVPAPLKPWIGWVLHDQDQRDCPIPYNAGGGRDCDWPSRLRLDLDGSGGRFELQLRLDAPGWVALPGSELLWPQ